MKHWPFAQMILFTTLRILYPSARCRSSQLLIPIASKSIMNQNLQRARSLAIQLTVRGGGQENVDPTIKSQSQQSTNESRTDLENHEKNEQYQKQSYTILSEPAPGSPFHYAFPVHDLQLAKEFYGNVLGCVEGRSSAKWQDYSLHGHQIVAHWVGNDYRCQDYYNPVDGDEVPVPHTGLALTVDQFHDLATRLRNAGVKFIIEPHLRFKGMPGEQYTMFFKDPSGNNLEFKAMTHPENLFAKYNVADS